MRKITAWILAFLFLTSLMPGISLAQDGFATQTIMVYIVGSDLEGDNGLATADIVEMLRSGMDTERVTVLVMTGGSEKWRAPMITVRNLSIFKVARRNPALLHQEPAKTWARRIRSVSSSISRWSTSQRIPTACCGTTAPGPWWVSARTTCLAGTTWSCWSAAGHAKQPVFGREPAGVAVL